jgi:hypothetical protein
MDIHQLLWCNSVIESHSGCHGYQSTRFMTDAATGLSMVTVLSWVQYSLVCEWCRNSGFEWRPSLRCHCVKRGFLRWGRRRRRLEQHISRCPVYGNKKLGHVLQDVRFLERSLCSFSIYTWITWMYFEHHHYLCCFTRGMIVRVFLASLCCVSCHYIVNGEAFHGLLS